MAKQITLETAFGTYTIGALLGEGGAGRVFAGTSSDGKPIALKLLAKDRASTEKRKRFKNETAFLLRNLHPNIVTVLDHGVSTEKDLLGPFYVMPKYDGSLRTRLKETLSPKQKLELFSKILDGVEAAHLQGVIHRDLKPENVLCNKDGVLVIADFGIAAFTDDIIVTTVETSPTTRLANFQYAAPEQRVSGNTITQAADIYALGLILAELFTGVVPHGTDFKKISEAAPEFAYLDSIVTVMIRNTPTSRPNSIGEVKGMIEQYAIEAINRQKLDALTKTVVPAGDITDPLAFHPPKIQNFDWVNGQLILTLDRPVSHKWVDALLHMDSHTSVLGHGPETFVFDKNVVRTNARDHEVKPMIEHMKQWLPKATAKLRQNLELEMRREEEQRRRQLAIQREAEERRARLLREVQL